MWCRSAWKLNVKAGRAENHLREICLNLAGFAWYHLFWQSLLIHLIDTRRWPTNRPQLQQNRCYLNYMVLPSAFWILFPPTKLSTCCTVHDSEAYQSQRLLLNVNFSSLYLILAFVNTLSASCYAVFLVFIAERYEPLPYPVCQLMFVCMKRELLEDYRIRLVQLRKEFTPTSPQYLAILNTTHYIISVLRDWVEKPVSFITKYSDDLIKSRGIIISGFSN